MEEKSVGMEKLLPVVLHHLRITGAAHPRVLTPIVNRLQLFQALPSSLTFLLTLDDTREAHSFLESDQY